ncbi:MULTISPECIES: GGDEF domain-containing protein [unclassified Sphingomonas]|uniref:GGDEF domain-containing protein n=1 Tax=unclassified Sphingomonas TaxID=196159 RepID=UPI0006FCFDCB|nr:MULTISPECIES: GGDEF domain-containing protein [unclassified Sphingomonas]KQX21581.1 diguanylate cyclase [Sphingomonas sp. Root1294]KQY72898.1 diguanylate cyclase [Sphingomonas sp. Root50]KRB88309.1 diguanylate cyclase [Sphingomonas sp. Root720]
MTAAVIIIIALIFSAAMLTGVMLIAWRSFGRPRHALVWAIAFAVATVEWIANLGLRIQAPDNAPLYAAIAGLGCLSNALIAAGFAQRSRPDAALTPYLLAAAVAALLIAGAATVVPHLGVRDATGLLFGGTMMAISTAHVGRRFRTASLPERSVTLMLMLFALIDLAMAAAAFRQGVTGTGDPLQLYRTILILLYPPAFIGVGLFSVFLVASDLAETMRMLATSDMLTGIYNRRGFEDSAERAIRNAQRQRQPLAVVVADIDRFKAINDRYGHGVGDRALRHFAGRIERLVRRGDLIGRIGGEEFALLLVNTRAQDAIEVVERIRRDIAAMPVNGPDRIVMTASFGVTGLRPGDISLASLLARADRALYQSKIGGRDRVTSAEELEDA